MLAYVLLPSLSVFAFERKHSMTSTHPFNTILPFTSLLFLQSTFFYLLSNLLVFRTIAKVPLVLMVEDQALLEKHLRRLLDLHVSLKRNSDQFWERHDNLEINLFSQKKR